MDGAMLSSCPKPNHGSSSFPADWEVIIKQM